MKDLIERLRGAKTTLGYSLCFGLVGEAADAIERLTAERDALAAQVVALRKIVDEYISAYDGASDQKAVGSTCRLIRAEESLRDMPTDTSTAEAILRERDAKAMEKCLSVCVSVGDAERIRRLAAGRRIGE